MWWFELQRADNARVLPSTFEYFRVLSSTSEYFQVLPRYFRVLLRTSDHTCARFTNLQLFHCFLSHFFLSTIWCVLFIVNKLLNLSRGKPPSGSGVDNLLSWHVLHFWICITFCIRCDTLLGWGKETLQSCTKKLDSIDCVYKICVFKIIIIIWFGDNVTVSHITGGIPQSWHLAIYS